MLKDPEGNKMRGVRMPNEMWDAMRELAGENYRSTTQEIIYALKYHLAVNGYEITDDEN
jgi:hypothetical protein